MAVGAAATDSRVPERRDGAVAGHDGAVRDAPQLAVQPPHARGGARSHGADPVHAERVRETLTRRSQKKQIAWQSRECSFAIQPAMYGVMCPGSVLLVG